MIELERKKKKKSLLRERLEKYKKIKYLLEKENQVNKCGLVPFRYSSIGKGREGVVYRLDLKKRKSLSLAVKVMKNDEYNRREAKNYDLFIDIVLSGKVPHFPLTWESIHCKNKCHFIDLSLPVFHKKYKKWEKIKEKECFLLFTELFDGDAENLLTSLKTERKKVSLSLFFQLMMALKIINDKGLVHGDLHLHNVLYKKISGKRERKFRYVIKRSNEDKEDIYLLKNFGFLFVVSDFEKMNPSGTISDHARDRTWLKDNFPDIFFKEGKPLNSIYWDLYILTNSLSYFSEDFEKIKDKFLTYTHVYDNTKTGPSIEEIIEDFSRDFPYIIEKEKNGEKVKKYNTFFL